MLTAVFDSSIGSFISFHSAMMRRCRHRVFVAAVVVAASAGSRSRACDLPPIDGCGKVHALIHSYFDESGQPRTAEPREDLGDTDVLHYDLEIEVSDFNFQFFPRSTLTGRNVMTIQSKSPALTEFTFRLRHQYTITGALLNGDTPVVVNTLSSTTKRVELDRTYGTDEVFTLTIEYTGETVAEGFGSIKVGVQGPAQTPVVFTLSEPYYAYSWWPVKDGDVGQPGDNIDKATMDFRITVPNNFKAPSNGVLISEESLGGGRMLYHWRSLNPIVPYLVSFGATTYNKWTRTYNYPGGTMPVEFYIYPSLDTTNNRTAWERCMAMLPVFRTVYGEYPFVNEKYGHYSFNFSGGMEHQTLSGMGGFGESLVAHELAHQWWGDMITCRTWHDIWLNEGFATYGECLWQERRTGGINSSAYFSSIQARKPSNVSATTYVYNVSNSSAIFNSNAVYNKGAWVLHQLRGVVGDATFFQILADYRTAFEYSAATTDDFAAVASNTFGQDLTWFFDQWVYQPGAPAYQFGWQTTNVNGQDYLLARIAQTHTTAGYPNVFTMPVELRPTVGGSPQSHTVWNDARTQWFVVPVSGPTTALSFDPNQWILRTTATSTSYVPGPPKIVQTTPSPGAAVDGVTMPDQLTVWFHTPVHASAANFTLTGQAHGVRSFTLAGETNVNPVTLLFDAPLPADTYTLEASGVVAANSGMVLDGEIADPTNPGSLPSGNGEAGGAAQIQFVVTPCGYVADINDDCLLNETDLQLFVQALLGQNVDASQVGRSDLDESGNVDGADIQPFVSAYMGR